MRTRSITIPWPFRMRRTPKWRLLLANPAASLAFVGGIGAGAAAAYLFDPARGRRRRAIAGDRARHLARTELRFLCKAARDSKNRARGIAARMRWGREAPDDDLLTARVRAELGHHVSHAGAIEVAVHDGVVTLRGPIMRDEIPDLVRAIRRVRGVLAVQDGLEPHDHDERVPSLQGGRSVSPARTQWTPSKRLMAAGLGVALTGLGLVRRGSGGLGVAAMGAALLLRCAANRSFGQMLGLGRAASRVTVQKSVTVNAGVDEVYGLWADLENLPRFLGHVRAIERRTDGRSEWHVRGPGRVPIRWTAQIVDHEAGRHMTWRTVSGPISHTGTIHFEPVDETTTRVHVRMSYRPPAGSLGHSIASLLGFDPKHTIDDDLRRMKQLLERREAGIEPAGVGVH
jgi:uncharacterized membrane protein